MRSIGEGLQHFWRDTELRTYRVARFHQVRLLDETFVRRADYDLQTYWQRHLQEFVENFSEYTRADRSLWANLLDAVNMRSGGLTYYGGFLLATPYR